jgi:glyoxylase-like metal-dependent hydrolase (beta-lactamase superfamily II)
VQIEILGTRGEIPQSCRRHSKHSGILVDDQLLIDVGEKSFLKRAPRWILLTHLHPDHAYFIRRGKVETPPTSALIYAPEIPPHEQLSHKIRLFDRKKRIGPYTVIPIPTHHSKQVKSQAYLVKRGGRSFLYTGDLIWMNKEYHPLIGTVDLVITEASFLRRGGMIRRDPQTGQLFGHNGIPNLVALLKPFSSAICLVHFGSWFYKDCREARRRLQRLGREEGIEVIVGYDGLRLHLGGRGGPSGRALDRG